MVEYGSGQCRGVSLYRFTSSERVPLEEGARVVGELKCKERTMRMFHIAIGTVVGPLNRCERKRFVVRARECVRWKCVSLLVSYFTDVPEGKVVSCVQYGPIIMRPCVCRTVTAEGIKS